MAFNKKEWKDGELGNTPITAEELNRIEQGIEDANNNSVGIINSTNITDKEKNTYSANIIDGLVQREIIKVFLSANVTKTATSSNQYVLVPLDKYSLVGNKLSFADNGIKIGKGVSKIKIDGILNIAETKANSNKGFCIYKNNSLVVQSTLGDVGTRSYSQNVMMGQILDVAENDIIQIYVRAIAISSDTNITINGNSGGAATYMTAEVLA